MFHYVEGFLQQIVNTPKKAGEAGGKTGILIGVGRWLMEYWGHFKKDVLVQIVDGCLITFATALTGVVVGYISQRILRYIISRFYKRNNDAT